MSRLRFGVLLLALAAAVPTELPAQRATVWCDSAAKLAVRIRALRDSMLQGDSTVKEVARNGDLVIGASEQLRGGAAEALERFAQARERWFGGASPSPQGFRIVLTEQPGGYYLGGNNDVGTWRGELVLAGLPDSGASVRVQRNVRRGQSADALIDAFAELMYTSAGVYIRRWLDLTAPLSMDEKERRTVAMYAVVTGTGRAQRGCVAGNFDDCGYALALRRPRDTAPGGGYPPFVRSDLLLGALEIGGPGAWARLRGAAGMDLERGLTAAAGIPADSLLARWRRGLLALRPNDAPMEAGMACLALAWAGALLLGALGASRWA